MAVTAGMISLIENLTGTAMINARMAAAESLFRALFHGED
jgi:hypothetical protein